MLEDVSIFMSFNALDRALAMLHLVRLRCQRQPDAHCCAMAWRVLDINATAVIGDDPMREAEAEAGSPYVLARGVERVKKMRDICSLAIPLPVSWTKIC